jgi:hypothetical protein
MSACDARRYGSRVPAIRHRSGGRGPRFGGLGARLNGAVSGCCSRSNAAQHRPDRDRLVRFDEDLLNRARNGRWDLGVDLVRGDLDERVVNRNAVTGLHTPLQHGALGDRVAHLREGDVDQLAAALRRLLGRRPGGSVAVGLYFAEHASHLNRFIGFGGDVYKRSGHGRRDLGIDLVGRDLDQGLVRLHPVAYLLQPAKDGAFGNRLPHLGHGDLNARGACGHPCPQL